MKKPTPLLGVLLAGAFLFSLALGYCMPLFSLVLGKASFSSAEIGFNAAAPAFGILLVSPLASRLLELRRAFLTLLIGGIALTSIVLIMPLHIELILWFLLRFAIGCIVAIISVALEAWANALSPGKNRGFWIGIYLAVSELGFAGGPALASMLQSDLQLSFVVGSGLFLVSVLPILLVSRSAPSVASAEAPALSEFARRAPIAMGASFLTGFIATGLVVMLPVIGVRTKLDTEASLLLITAMLIGGVVSQPVLAFWSDRLGRRELAALGAIITAGASTMLLQVSAMGPMLIAVFAILGAGTQAMHASSLALIGDQFRSTELAASHAALLCFYVIGNCLGPLIYGLVTDRYGMTGLGALTFSFCLVLAVWAIKSIACQNNELGN